MASLPQDLKRASALASQSAEAQLQWATEGANANARPDEWFAVGSRTLALRFLLQGHGSDDTAALINDLLQEMDGEEQSADSLSTFTLGQWADLDDETQASLLMAEAAKALRLAVPGDSASKLIGTTEARRRHQSASAAANAGADRGLLSSEQITEAAVLSGAATARLIDSPGRLLSGEWKIITGTLIIASRWFSLDSNETDMTVIEEVSRQISIPKIESSLLVSINETLIMLLGRLAKDAQQPDKPAASESTFLTALISLSVKALVTEPQNLSTVRPNEDTG